jgi:DNA replication licensing factor MCM2
MAAGASSSLHGKRRRPGPVHDEEEKNTSMSEQRSELGSLPSSPTSLSTPPPFSSSPVRDDEEEELMGMGGMMDSDADRLQPEEEEGEDLFGPDMENDYKEMPHLDIYDIEGLDEEEYSPVAPEAKAAAEAEMKRRDRERFANDRHRRIPAVLAAALDETPDEDNGTLLRSRPLASRRRQRLFDSTGGGGDSQLDRMMDDDSSGIVEEFEDSALERLKELDGYKLREELTLQGYRLKFAKKFRTFLTTFVDDKGHSVYFEKIKHLAESKVLRVGEGIIDYSNPR